MVDTSDIGYQDLKQELADIQLWIRRAHLWAFLPDEWLHENESRSLTCSSLFQQLSDRNTTFSTLTNYEVAKQCILKATDDELFPEAMAIIFVVDRFAYHFKNESETQELLARIKRIRDKCPDVAVAPQLMIREVRWLKDRGDYQSADRIVNSLFSVSADCFDKEEDDLKIDTWKFETREDFIRTVYLLLMLKGQIQVYLAQPVDAAVYLAASARLEFSLEHLTYAGGQCLPLLLDIILDMGSSQREELQNVLIFQAVPETPLIEYFTENRDRIFDCSLPVDSHFPKHMHRVARLDLMRLVDAKQTDSETFCMILRHLVAGLPEKLEWAIFEIRDIARSFALSVFNVHIIFDYFGHACKDVLLLSMQLFIKACGMSSEKDLDHIKHEMNKVRSKIRNFSLGTDSDKANNRTDLGDRYPVLRSASPDALLRAFKNSDASAGHKSYSLLTNVDLEGDVAAIDPVATTLLSSGVLPRNTEKFNSNLFQFAEEDINVSNATSAEAVISEGTVYQSLLSEPIKTVDGFSAPQKLLKTKEKRDLKRSNPTEEYVDLGIGDNANSDAVPVSSQMILNTKLRKNTIYQANVARFYIVEDQWRYQKTLVFVDDELQLTKNKGRMRDAIKLRYLHQDHFAPDATYLGKHYRCTAPPETYRNDVIMHQLSLQSVARFNKLLQPYPRFANRIRMVPVVHMEILDATGHVLEVMNVEPYIRSKFTKFTNNLDKVNLKFDSELLLAFSHFTWCDSEEKFMVTDLQGFLPEDPRIAIILTDPAINSERLDYLGITNMGKEGLIAFWTKQHPTCNEVCHLLKLHKNRPNYATIVGQ